MAIYTISNEETRFCRQAMVQCGGRWDAERKLWMFRQLADAADAAIKLYLGHACDRRCAKISSR